MENLETLNLLSRRLWKSKLDNASPFTFSEEEAKNCNIDIIKYFRHCRNIVRSDLELKTLFTPTDLLDYLQNVEDNKNKERYARVLVAYGELFDEEFHLFAELLFSVEADLIPCLDELKIWLLLRIWNSQYNMYDPQTDLLIEKYLDDDGEFKEHLVSICYHGVNNPAFCRWTINHWSDCSYYHRKMLKYFHFELQALPEQVELLNKIKSLE